MTDPQTVSESFIRWMEDNGYGVFDPTGNSGTIFINQVPEKATDNAYWIVTSGGDVSQLNVTRESVQQFNVQVNYRNKSGRDVEHILFALNQQVNSRTVLNIEGFDLHSIEASMPEDNDKDVENRRQGQLTVAIQIYVS